MPLTRRRFLTLSTAVGAASTVPFSVSSAGMAPVSGNDSGARWQPRDLPRKPNIAIVVLDDVGFADFSCYGSEGLTPAIDQLADNGARFNNFHVTALCAPTRACLLTGSNAHAVGVGNIAEWGRDHPGYRGWIRPDALTLAEMLRPQGYSTMALGKWHLSSLSDQNVSGPHDHWPVGRGFDRWYGAHGNAIDHFHPEIFENTVQVRPDKRRDYHFSADLVDRASHYVRDHIAATDNHPFFMYLAFGACHFPFHPPKRYLDAARGRYDAGWDVLREQRFERQRELGILPAGTALSPRGPNVQEWKTLSDDERRVAARMQEAYAAFLQHTDDQIQRLVDMLRAEGQLDNTILMVLSDNGAAAGGPSAGMLDVRRVSYLEPESIQHLVNNIDNIGTEHSQCIYGPGWGHAGNAPLKWFKGDTYGGGTRSPLVVHWPDGGIAGGTVLSQYHHITDLVPSLLEMSGNEAPKEYNGQQTLPIQGTSFAYAFDHADAPTAKPVQYFETLGDRAIWHDGWKAVVRHHGEHSFEDDVWELYHTAEDFSEVHNLAEPNADRLMQMVNLWDIEAHKYNILPLANNTLELYAQAVPPARRRHVFYPGMTRLDRLSAPDIYAYDSALTADVEIDAPRAQGVLLASGDGGAGYEWFLLDGRMIFTYVFTREQRYTIKTRSRIPTGITQLGLRISKTDTASAEVALLANEQEVARGVLPKMWPIYTPNAGLRCGANDGAPISAAYRAPFAFDQTLTRIVVDVDKTR